jgi:hypothetical protein
MPKRMIFDAFVSWVAQNRSRFNHEPIITNQKNDFLYLRLLGIASEISCLLTNSDLVIHVIYKKVHWDIITTFDAPAIRSRVGQYYCGRCEPEYRKMFASPEDLCAAHCFEPFLKWTNEKLKPTTWLCLFRRQGCTWVEMLDDTVVEQRRTTSKGFKLVLPAVSSF